MDNSTRGQWETPKLQFKGGVGDILKSGGGKLSLTGAGSWRDALREAAHQALHQIGAVRPLR